MFNMTTTLILLKDGRNILVSNEQPVTGWYFDTFINKIRNTSNAEYGKNDITKKIIAGIESLPTLTYSNEVKQELRDKYGRIDLEELRNRFKETPEWDFYEIVKAHQSITDKMFSLEQLEGFINYMYDHKTAHKYKDGYGDFSQFSILMDKYIQSLQQPIQLKVEVEMEEVLEKGWVGEWTELKPTKKLIPKITNNSILITKILS